MRPLQARVQRVTRAGRLWGGRRRPQLESDPGPGLGLTDMSERIHSFVERMNLRAVTPMHKRRMGPSGFRIPSPSSHPDTFASSPRSVRSSPRCALAFGLGVACAPMSRGGPKSYREQQGGGHTAMQKSRIVILGFGTW
jgi:hypothetical protein